MIPIYKPSLLGNEAKYVADCVETTWISSRGEYINKFEAAFGKYIGAEHCTTVSNGTVALHLAMEALGIGEGDEVIVPAFTYVASVNTIVQTGAKPVYVDSLESTWNIDPVNVIKKITPKTKAIMAVHLYGLACDMDALDNICSEYNLLLIEDCAEAFGTYYKGRHVGTFGDVATFSFFGNKTITTGEGGMVVCKTEKSYDKACHLKSQGVSKTREYWHDAIAYNYRMTNLCAAIGLAQLERADEILKKKKTIALWYSEGLVGLPLKLQEVNCDLTHSYWMCSVLAENKEIRNGLRDSLKCEGVDTRPLFPPVNTMPHVFSDEYFKVATMLGDCGFNLPSFPDLTQENVLYICSLIRNFFK
ncbi:DegT/DnrJ/EryC1/StrS family aminotransferase [Vibrio qinghaiensis]|uniref:GDP-perosamine synthase n=1 Tax=Vibrio qinghaiensis TaxID=2025808 RepID=A0A223N0W5_9VIBR|nr:MULTISPECIES: DegT/DnrJ/EryC1/StrS family aminotransferase [Vibrio]ASU23347.1 DegT/DnrJ/EryC1/StrS family aminotransferase [Vibrio qinghaiensis]OEE76867.1 perosamine synthetase [Vibrio ordalii FF-167]